MHSVLTVCLQEEEVTRAFMIHPSTANALTRMPVSCAHTHPQHKLWMYDLRVGKRPQVDMEWGDARVTALAADPDGRLFLS